MSSGQLVSIEGIDGAGKTSVIKGTEKVNGLEDVLSDVVYTTEPDDETWLGKVVRDSISSGQPDHIPERMVQGETAEAPPVSVFFLFLAEHANHVESTVRPALENGKTVVCDRYIDSRYAYQSRTIADYVEGNALDYIRCINNEKWTEIPDTTILLDVGIETAVSRLEGDEIFEDRSKLEHFQEVYHELAQDEQRYEVVDAEQPLEDVISNCLEVIEQG